MIVCVVPNPAIDVTYTLDLRRGSVNRPRTVCRRAGGKGVNVARLLGLWATESVVILPLGGLSGDWLQRQLDIEGFTSDSVRIADETRHTVTLVEPEGHPTAIYESGPTVTASEWRELDAKILAACAPASALVISGSMPPGVDGDRVAKVIRRAAQPDFPVVVDTSGSALLHAARAGATCLKPNESELMAATGRRSWTAGARCLLEMGAQSVMVSRGDDGLVFCSREGYLASPGIACRAGNPTGAGDAVVASIATSLVARRPRDELVRHANAAGAAASTKPLAGELDVDDMKRFADLATSKEYEWDW